MRLRQRESWEGLTGNRCWKNPSPQTNCQYGFSIQRATTSSSENLIVCWMRTRPTRLGVKGAEFRGESVSVDHLGQLHRLVVRVEHHFQSDTEKGVLLGQWLGFGFNRNPPDFGACGSGFWLILYQKMMFKFLFLIYLNVFRDRPSNLHTVCENDYPSVCFNHLGCSLANVMAMH